MITLPLFPMPALPPVTVPKHPSGERFSIQVFSVEDSSRMYVGLPVDSIWTSLSGHLFTRETAERIVHDLHTWDADWGVRGEFAADGTLIFTSTAAFDDVGGEKIITPDRWNRYKIGGIWDWDNWHRDGSYLSDEQGAFLRGACEYRESDETASLPTDLQAAFALGRAESHRLTLHLDDTPEGALRAALAEYRISAHTDKDGGNSWLAVPFDQDAEFVGSGPQLLADVMVEDEDKTFVDEVVGIRCGYWRLCRANSVGHETELLAVPADETERVAAYIADLLTAP